MKAYYKTSNGKVVELEQQVELYLHYRNIVELIIPDGCEDIRCWNNQLKKLNIPNGCKFVDCSYNQLTELIIPDSCVEVVADMKSITVLNEVRHLSLII